MSTDRPDKTESPYMVDAGHFPVEADLVSFGIDQRNAEGARVFAALPFLAAKFPHRQFNSAELRVLSGVGRTAFPMRGAKALSGEVRSHAGRKRELQLAEEG
jgi:hypothetical protein